jgi:hypothetical protein
MAWSDHRSRSDPGTFIALAFLAGREVRRGEHAGVEQLARRAGERHPPPVEDVGGGGDDRPPADPLARVFEVVIFNLDAGPGNITFVYNVQSLHL